MSLPLRNFKNVAEHFNCPIHLGKLRDPRRLACEHTFCAECLNKCIHTALSTRNDGMFECPVCRIKHHIPNSEIGDFARGFPVDAFCVIQLHTLSQYEKSTLCEKHIEKFKEYFCFTHREILCSDCVVESHTKAPCSCGSLQDSLMEVRLQIKELIGKLRLQEERAKRIMASQVAMSHSEELVKRIAEVEKMLAAFNKTMKKRLKEAKQEVVEATKISQADRDHLSTVYSLIAKTKSHVQDVISTKSSRSPEGVNEILSTWTPLEKEVENFDDVLNEVETQPFCVDVKADERFMEFLRYEQLPIFVTKEKSKGPRHLPETPKKGSRNLEHKHDTEGSHQKHVRIADNNSSSFTSLEMIRTFSLTSPIKQGSHSKLFESRPKTEETAQVFSLSPSGNTSPSRKSPSKPILKPSSNKSSALSRVSTLDIKTRDTGHLFKEPTMHLKGISEVSSFDLPCADILIMDKHIITITEYAVQKFSLDYKFIEGIALRCPWRMCGMKDSSHVAINHNTRFISIVNTSPILNVLYRIETNKPYAEICHMRTSIQEDRFGRTKYLEYFAMSHTTDLRADCIDMLTVSYDHNPYSNFTSNQTTKLTPFRVKTIIGSDKNSVIRSPNALAATSDGKRLIVGGESAIVCIKRSGDILWSRPVCKYVSSICCEKGLVYVCVEYERKLMVLDEAGNLLQENIFPMGNSIVRPNRISVERSAMIVREFSESDWKSSIHLFNLSFE